MNQIELKEDELIKISNIVKRYREIENELDDINDKLQSIEKNKTKLLNLLDNTRVDEVKLFSKLKKRYGEGKLDLTTFKYIKS